MCSLDLLLAAANESAERAMKRSGPNTTFSLLHELCSRSEDGQLSAIGDCYGRMRGAASCDPTTLVAVGSELSDTRAGVFYYCFGDPTVRMPVKPVSLNSFAKSPVKSYPQYIPIRVCEAVKHPGCYVDAAGTTASAPASIRHVLDVALTAVRGSRSHLTTPIRLGLSLEEQDAKLAPAQLRSVFESVWWFVPAYAHCGKEVTFRWRSNKKNWYTEKRWSCCAAEIDDVECIRTIGSYHSGELNGITSGKVGGNGGAAGTGAIAYAVWTCCHRNAFSDGCKTMTDPVSSLGAEHKFRFAFESRITERVIPLGSRQIAEYLRIRVRVEPKRENYIARSGGDKGEHRVSAIAYARAMQTAFHFVSPPDDNDDERWRLAMASAAGVTSTPTRDTKAAVAALSAEREAHNAAKATAAAAATVAAAKASADREAAAKAAAAKAAAAKEERRKRLRAEHEQKQEQRTSKIAKLKAELQALEAQQLKENEILEAELDSDSDAPPPPPPPRSPLHADRKSTTALPLPAPATTSGKLTATAPVASPAVIAVRASKSPAQPILATTNLLPAKPSLPSVTTASATPVPLATAAAHSIAALSDRKSVLPVADDKPPVATSLSSATRVLADSKKSARRPPRRYDEDSDADADTNADSDTGDAAAVAAVLAHVKDTRKKKLTAVREQRKAFRERVMKQFNGRCILTGCSVPEVLDAAHIIPYSGKESNPTVNGLLLRTDLHRLFDANLLVIHIVTNKAGVVVSSSIRFDADVINAHHSYVEENSSFMKLNLHTTLAKETCRRIALRNEENGIALPADLAGFRSE